MTDPGVLPSCYVSIMTFEFCRDDATRESYLAIILALFDCFSTKNLWVCSTLTNMNFLLMGVIALYKFSFAFFTFLGIKNFVGCATSAPDGSSLRGYSRKNISSIGSSKFSFFHPSRSSIFLIISSGARPALPMVVASKAIVEYFWV
jgi:hypothetical protein